MNAKPHTHAVTLKKRWANIDEGRYEVTYGDTTEPVHCRCRYRFFTRLGHRLVHEPHTTPWSDLHHECENFGEDEVSEAVRIAVARHNEGSLRAVRLAEVAAKAARDLAVWEEPAAPEPAAAPLDGRYAR